ncbi:MAG: DUF3631 domain-containing protein [Nitrospinae bacterium]|nr:DUF3631 domain-containing protein [Nitrospinota bacterium]
MSTQAELIAQEMLNGKGENTDPRLGDLLEELERHFLTFIRFPDKSLAMLCSLWVVLTYCYDLFYYCAYLAFRSATPGCGKTQALTLLSLFSKGQPLIMTCPSPAVLFRIPNQVLLLDEVDKLRNQDKEKTGDILAILDSGYIKNGMVPRCVGNNHEVKFFSVYGPKALAGIESLADTLAARSLFIELKRESKRLPRLSERRLEETARKLRHQLLVWVDLRRGSIEQTYGELSEDINGLTGYEPRFQDLAEPLYVLASLADAEREGDSEADKKAILPKFLKSLQVVATKRIPTGREESLLAFLDIAEEHLNERPEAFIKTSDLLEAFKDREELSWIESGRKLANILRPFELFPKNMAQYGGRGYLLTLQWVQEWRQRYGQQDTQEG